MTYLNPHPSTTNEDQIFRRYLDRAIVELNELEHEICEPGACNGTRMPTPVLGTGHPLASLFMVKARPRPSEIREGIAFFGEAGEAIVRCLQRLNVDASDVYGTNLVKCLSDKNSCSDDGCPSWLRRELSIIGPKMLIVLGEDALAAINALELDHTTILNDQAGVVQSWSMSCAALYCPDIDQSLESPTAKHEFWQAIRALGAWYDERPPY